MYAVCNAQYIQQAVLYTTVQGVQRNPGSTKELQGVPRNYREYQGTTESTKELQGVPRNSREYQETTGITKELQGVPKIIPRSTKELQGVLRNSEECEGNPVELRNFWKKFFIY